MCAVSLLNNGVDWPRAGSPEALVPSHPEVRSDLVEEMRGMAEGANEAVRCTWC